MAGGLLHHRRHPGGDTSLAQVQGQDGQILTFRFREVEDKPQLHSSVVRVVFEVGEEAVEDVATPAAIGSRDVDAPLRQTEEYIGGDVARDRGLAEGLEGRRVEAVDALGNTPRGEGAQNADVPGLVDGLECGSLRDNGVSPGERKEAPVRPIPEFLTARKSST